MFINDDLDVRFCEAFFLLMPKLIPLLSNLYLQVMKLSVLMVYFRMRVEPVSTSAVRRSLNSDNFLS